MRISAAVKKLAFVALGLFLLLRPPSIDAQGTNLSVNQLFITGSPATAVPSVCLGLSPALLVSHYPCTQLGGVSPGPNVSATIASNVLQVSLASPVATALPSSCAGWDLNFNLQYFTCNSGTLSAVNPGPNISANISGTTLNVSVASPAATACPSSAAGFSSTFGLTFTAPAVCSVSPGPNISAAISITNQLQLSVASPAATACPSSVAGWSSTFGLTFTSYNCATPIATITTGPNLTGGGNGPTPAALSVASPTATACASSVAGWSSTFVLQFTNGCAAIANQSTTAFSITVLPTATTLATPVAGFYSRAQPLSLDLNAPTIDGIFGYCDTAGSGGSKVTVQFYESFGTSPTFSTANPIGTAVSWPTGSSLGGGATFPATALPTSTTAGNETWVFAVVQAIPTTPPSGNCSFTLHGLQKIKL